MFEVDVPLLDLSLVHGIFAKGLLNLLDALIMILTKFWQNFMQCLYPMSSGILHENENLTSTHYVSVPQA